MQGTTRARQMAPVTVTRSCCSACVARLLMWDSKAAESESYSTSSDSRQDRDMCALIEASPQCVLFRTPMTSLAPVCFRWLIRCVLARAGGAPFSGSSLVLELQHGSDSWQSMFACACTDWQNKFSAGEQAFHAHGCRLAAHACERASSGNECR